MIYHAFWVNIETTCDVFGVFYYGLTHVSANKDNDHEVYVYKLFTHLSQVCRQFDTAS